MIIVVPCKIAIYEAGNGDRTQLDEAEKEEQVKPGFLPTATRSGRVSHRNLQSGFLKCVWRWGRQRYVCWRRSDTYSDRITTCIACHSPSRRAVREGKARMFSADILVGNSCLVAAEGCFSPFNSSTVQLAHVPAHVVKSSGINLQVSDLTERHLNTENGHFDSFHIIKMSHQHKAYQTPQHA